MAWHTHDLLTSPKGRWMIQIAPNIGDDRKSPGSRRSAICSNWLNGLGRGYYWWLRGTRLFLKRWHRGTAARSSWASCQIRKIAGAHAPGMPGTFSPPSGSSYPDMHHGTCMTHVSWCMPGSLTSGFPLESAVRENVPGIPGACAMLPAMLRIW